MIKNLLLSLVIVFLYFNSFSQGSYRNVYKESAWEDRDKWQKPDQILEAMLVKPGSKVADLGCHQGYMTVKLAEAVGETGKVYGVDVNQTQLNNLEANLKKRNLTEFVEVIKGDYDDPKLPENKLDALLIIDAYHEMDDYEKILKHVFASLKPKGRLVIIEPIAKERESWSRTKQTEKHEISIRYVIKDLKKAGFKLVADVNPFIDRTDIKGDVMWMLVAEKP